MASNSGWTKGLPSGQSKVSNTDEEFRSLKSFVEAWTETEHYATGGSATSAGVHRLGSGRAFVGTVSQLSNPTGDNGGRLFWATDTETLYVAQASSSSWSAIADAIKLDSRQTWTAHQEFTSAISTSQATISDRLYMNGNLFVGGTMVKSGVFNNIISGITFVDVVSIAASGDTFFTHSISGSFEGAPFLVDAQDSNLLDSGIIMHAHGTAGGVNVTLFNLTASPVDLSATTFRMIGFVPVA